MVRNYCIIIIFEAKWLAYFIFTFLAWQVQSINSFFIKPVKSGCSITIFLVITWEIFRCDTKALTPFNIQPNFMRWILSKKWKWISLIQNDIWNFYYIYIFHYLVDHGNGSNCNDDTLQHSAKALIFQQNLCHLLWLQLYLADYPNELPNSENIT